MSTDTAEARRLAHEIMGYPFVDCASDPHGLPGTVSLCNRLTAALAELTAQRDAAIADLAGAEDAARVNAALYREHIASEIGRREKAERQLEEAVRLARDLRFHVFEWNDNDELNRQAAALDAFIAQYATPAPAKCWADGTPWAGIVHGPCDVHAPQFAATPAPACASATRRARAEALLKDATEAIKEKLMEIRSANTESGRGKRKP